jgi:hypothetical protein
MFNVAKAGVLLLCILLALCALCGCANGAKSDASAQEFTAIHEKWEKVIHNDKGYVARIDIGSYVSQPIHSSTATVLNDVTIEQKEQFDSLLEILSNQTVEFKAVPTDLDTYMSYINSKAGKQMVSISFFDSNEQKILKINVYEDSTADIFEPAINPEEEEVWRCTCHAVFNEQIYETIKAEFSSVN